jgi:hypothetical protein
MEYLRRPERVLCRKKGSTGNVLPTELIPWETRAMALFSINDPGTFPSKVAEVACIHRCLKRTGTAVRP